VRRYQGRDLASNPTAGEAEVKLRAGAVALIAGVLCLFAQSGPSRDGYRAAYKSWRELDPGLERDAGTAGAALAPRTAKAADAAAAYGAARIGFLHDMSDRQAENLNWLRDIDLQPLPDLAPAPDLIRFANRELNVVSAIASTFANDSSKTIQQLRQTLQREQDAIEAVRTAIGDRQAAEEKATKASLTAEQARGKALEQYPFLASALAQSESLMKQEAAAWTAYYPALAEAARPPAPAVSSVSDEQSSNLQNQARAITSAPSPAAVRPPSITTLPLSRYVGVWGYQAGGLFLGTQPEFVDVAVHEENGHATGTFYARFKMPAGSSLDPVLRFTFSGDFTPDRNQTFKLETGDGVMGTIELIPAGPFNVLEVNFNTDAKPGKVEHGDMMLVKQ
jgi:hypothetical protein